MLHNQFENGVDVVLKENHFSKMVSIQCIVWVGSIDESEDERGLAHLLEHMLFKGTDSIGVGELSAKIEGYGGEINAYTTFDKTVYSVSLTSDHAEECIGLLADAVFNSSILEVELDREKEVVLEEIRRGNDSPANKVGRQVFSQVYSGSEAGRPIIGYEKQIQHYSRSDVLAFYKKWYQPSNISIVAVGDFNPHDYCKVFGQHFGGRLGRPIADKVFVPRDSLNEAHVEIIKGDFQQPRLEIAWQAPPLEHPDTVGLDLAAFAMGYGDSSRLSRRLRDEQALVAAAGCSLYSPTFGGVFELSAFPQEGGFLDVVRGLAREVALVKYREPITNDELLRARANLAADRIYQDETVSGQAESLSFGLGTQHQTFFMDVYNTLITKTDQEQVQSAIDCWLHDDRLVIVGLLPSDSNINEAKVLEAWKLGYKDALDLPPQVSNKCAPSDKLESDVETISLGPGKSLIYRQNKHSKMFNLVAASEGGLRGEAEQNPGIYNAIASLLCSATETQSYAQLLEYVEGRGATLEGYSGKDSFGLKLQCLTDQAEEMIGIWVDCFLNPVFPEQQWETVKREIFETIKSEDDSSASIALKNLQEIIFSSHPYRHPVYGTMKTYEDHSTTSLKDEYLSLRDGGPWVISCVGSLPSETVTSILKMKLTGWDPKVEKRLFQYSEKARKIPESRKLHIHKDREQTHLAIGYLGLSWGDIERPALDVLSMILGGSGGRLFLRLRDEKSLAYTVTPISTYGIHEGMIGGYIACAPEKVGEAMRDLERELLSLAHQKPEKVEVDRAVQYLTANHEADMQRGESQAMTMALMEVYGYGYDDFLKYPLAVRKVTQDDVQRVAQRLLLEQPMSSVVVGKTGEESLL